MNIDELKERYRNGERNFSFADLKRTDLSYYHWRDINLSQADLSGVQIRQANLTGANLSNTNLKYVWFYFVDLSNADLRGCDLSQNNLKYVNLRNANLSGARIDSADLNAVVFCNTTMPDGSICDDSCDLESFFYNSFRPPIA